MKESLQSLIGQGKTEQTIERLIDLTRSERELHQQALVLSGRFQKYLREKHGGTENAGELDVELNRINAAALDLMERLPVKQGLGNSQWNWQKVVLWLGIFAAIAGITGYTLRDFFKNKELPPSVVKPVLEPNLEDTSDRLQESPDTKPSSPPETKEVKNNVHIEVKDQAKVGNIITGDSNKIEIKQDF